MKNVVQIAGIKNISEAQMLIECGIEYIGIPLFLDYHKEDISIDEATYIIKQLNGKAKFVLITYLEKAEEILNALKRMGTDIVQVHGKIELDELNTLQKSKITIFKSLIINNNLQEIETQVSTFSPYVDAFITDTFDPDTGASGATGKVHDWDISKRVVEISPKPVILAGGLTADNVREAISIVKPAGVDAHTGVEDIKGDKDRGKVISFYNEARITFDEIGG